MSEKNKYLTDIKNIIGLMKEEIEDISPLRLQKTLYFLFAYYGASYGQLSKSKDYELSKDESLNLPNYLFDVEFEAWQYGPVIREVYKDNKYSDSYKELEFSMNDFDIEDKTMKKEITEYLREIIRSTYKVSDFGLVERSHEDKEWNKNIANQSEMDNELIIKEYIEIVNA
ncbi:Panacea domain-containing protein [Staphylococcus succinus]|uniref:Panacea domain-containing protein n=2 Tax=Bacillati TaxID=1783272 RepID=UPI000E67EC53|nr:type II toxin-antitoxin system antitoxin SocA domain-containing protein [Staphylococcus succinus]RIN43258.1 DUF4065 domain-containing protein [Staphylococcus succinus]